MRFLMKWIFRGALFAAIASAMHSCGAGDIYSDDDSDTPAASANAPAGRPS